MIYVQLVFILILDKLVWGISPNIASLCGVALILCSAFYVAMDHESEAHRVSVEDESKDETEPELASLRPGRSVLDHVDAR